MTLFDDREKAEERRFVDAQTAAFRIRARRNRLVGLWAAELIGLHHELAAGYAADLVRFDADEANDDGLIAKLRADLAHLGVSEHRIRHQLDVQSALAREQLQQR